MAGIIQEAADDAVARYRRFRESLTAHQEGLFDTLLFLTTFTVLAAPVYVVMAAGWESSTLRTVNASISTVILSLAGLDVTSYGSVIDAQSLTLDVSWDSTGWKSVMAFTALVVATGASVRKTLGGIIVGVPVLLIANIGRITSMVYLVEVYGVSYDMLHDILWRWGLTVTVLAVWIVWLYSDQLHKQAKKRLLAY